MNPLGMLDSLSVTGGSAAPSNAMGPGTLYLAMNQPFNVVGQGGKLNSTMGEGSNAQVMLVLALIVGAVLVVVMK